MTPTVDAVAPAFLNGGGQVGALMRAHDWSGSGLGDPSTWPQSLRSVVELMLNSKFPMFLVWGPQLCCLYNDAYVDILGSKHPWALGRRFQEVWSEIWDDLIPLVDQALKGEAVFRENLPLTMHRHGFDEPVWFTFSYSPVRDESGEVAGMYCACVETTEQVLAESYRKEENERFRALFEQAPGFMAILRGKDFVFDLTNHAYSQMVGHREIVGKPARVALPEVVDQGFISLLDQVYESGEPYVGRAVPVKLQRRPDEPLEERFLDFVYQPIRDARGAVTGIFAQGSDVTEHKRAGEELRLLAANLSQANRRQSEFLATLAHELRNPLAPMRTALDLMRIAPDSASLARTRDLMERQLGHLVHLVNDLLDVARISTGKIELKKERVLLRDIVVSAVETTLPGIEARNQDLRVQVPDEPIWLDADPNRLAQVIGNLLTNARKYTGDGGRIELAVRREGNEAVVVVADDGIGISADSLPHIFDMFTQVGHGIDHSQGGLGIGLSLVRRLTGKHGGRVEAHSAGPGQGSTFTLWLPIAGEPEPAAAVAAPGYVDPRPAAQRPLRILIADDNRDAAELLKEVLEIDGHVVRVAHDGRSALELAKDFVPDLALLDLGMPVMNGYELAKAMRQTPQLRSARLAAITGWGAKEDRERSKAAGFDHHLTKPVDLGTLHGLLSGIR
ncbi:hybrid sensor histidine kinase/response regulator [Ramlibacter sp.]|uniref:hybrid sensor histidine kinase/response regulator n=1 Tax=Ramlibacter sp. TaxID=1917967 RepID=UPI002D3D9A47|nr:ATP-binding protein [Ramlibacter sp.]HYD77623.1 ATP-binding protein [Ramlibacter sp.]